MAVHSKPRGLVGMLLTVFVLLQVAVAFQHNAHKHPAHRSAEAMEAHYQDTRNLLVERANNVAIKGATDSSQYPRIEIRDMIKKTDQWNLFLLAMERFKAKDKSDRLSYYQICGIHGRPFVAWNNQSPKHTAGSCPHNSAMFGSWHRPYLALYEQAVYQNAQEVIATFPSSQQQKWKNALVGLRIPYYDWAMDPPSGQPNVPASITDQTVTVTKPSGRVSITNPLYSYSFGSSLPSEMGWGPHNGYPVTLRHPVDNPTRSNNAEMNAVFGQARVGWRQRVFALFASKKNWGLASNSQYGVSTSRSNSDSYESIHDEIHGNAGGNDGHMSYLDVAAFDPMFWLHHANIDRLLTMHQWLATNTYVAANTVTRDTMYMSAGENKDRNSPLIPFTKDTSGSYYTSTDVESTRALGYYYPETANRQYSQVVTAINKLYGAGERAITKRDNSQDYASIYPGRAFKAGDYDTVLDIVGDKWALPGSYQVHCFLGNKPASNSSSSSNSTVPSFTNSTVPATNGTSTNATGAYGYPSNFVGSHTFLGGSVASNNGSGTTLAEGCIPLTAALQGKEASGELKSLNPDDVEPYLKDNLWYKIVGPGGKEYQPEEIPSFHVKVKSCEVTPASGDDELPTYHEYIDLPRVNLPATKPWTYTPTYPQPSSSPSEGAPQYTSYPGSSYPTGAMPWDEPGYCVSHQTIKYVDPEGNYLYSESN